MTSHNLTQYGFSQPMLQALIGLGYDDLTEVQKMVSELGSGYSLEWAGQSREEAKGSSQTTLLYAFAAVAVFLALAAL